jgi:hypothetical protein
MLKTFESCHVVLRFGDRDALHESILENYTKFTKWG